MSPKVSPLDRVVRIARGRLVRQLLLNKLAVCLAVALGLALVWFVMQPLLLESPPKWLRWVVLGGLTGVGFLIAGWWTRQAAPSREFAALEIDSRFNLRERVTTAVALTPELRQSSAGQALLADAEEKIKPILVSEKFPVKPRWPVALVPAFALAILAVVLWWNPSVIDWRQAAAVEATKGTETAKATTTTTQKQSAAAKSKVEAAEKREGKSAKLEELEKELEKLNGQYKDPFDETPEKNRERVADLTPLEDKMKKFNEEKEQKLQQLQDKLSQLEKLNKDQDFDDGPAKELNDALAKGDLKKAEQEVDELKKKAKDGKLNKEDAQKLSKQLEKMKDEIERLARDKERKEKLKKDIEQAKKEGKDAESLERELEKMEQDEKAAAEMMEKLAKQMASAADAFDKEDLEQAAEELAKAGKTLEEIEAEVEDLKEGEATLQRLKELRQKAAEACGL